LGLYGNIAALKPYVVRCDSIGSGKGTQRSHRPVERFF
jgi:hypothetical protein